MTTKLWIGSTKMSEEAVEATVDNLALRAGWLVRKVSWQGRRGAPDKAYIGFGRFVLIEFKKPGEVLEGQQSREWQRLKNAYPEVYACDNVADALHILGIAA